MLQSRFNKFQKGVTLLELIAGLAVIATVVVGALALFNSASVSQSSTQLSQDVTSIRAAVKQLYQGQGGYGTASLNNTLVVAKRVPTTVLVDTSTTPNTLRHGLDGTIAIVGATTQFSMTLTNIPAEICIPLMTGSGGWTTISAGGQTARALPITLATASTDCQAGTTMVFTGT